jgi:hypothetical protein
VSREPVLSSIETRTSRAAGRGLPDAYFQPDEYQGENAGSSLEALAVYLSPPDAKEFANGVLKAVERAEAEVARRRAQKGRKATQAAKAAFQKKKAAPREQALEGTAERQSPHRR